MKGHSVSFVGLVVLLLSFSTASVNALSANQYANLVLGEGSFTAITNGTGQRDLSNPSAAAFDSSGNLWVTDSNNSRVLEFPPPFTSGMRASLVIGQPNFTGFNPFANEAPSPTNSNLSGPAGLSFDRSGNLWVADTLNSRVLEFPPPFTSGMRASLVIGQPNFTTNSVATNQNSLIDPADLAFDSSGNLWVADTGNSRVLEFAAPFSNGMQASLVIGQPSFTTSVGGGPGTRLYTPVPLAFDPSGNLWVADSGNRMLEFVPPFANGMQASLLIGQPDFQSFTADVGQKSVHGPEGLTFDSSGNLWLADTGNSRVLEYLGDATSTMGADTMIKHGSASANQAAQTGISVSLNGSSAADGTAVNIFSAQLRTNPLATVNLVGARFYAVRIAGIVDGTANVCVSNASVNSRTTIYFYSGGAWVLAAGLARTADNTVCVSIPVPTLTGSYLSEGDLPSSARTTNTSPSTSSYSAPLLFGFLAVVALILAVLLVIRVRHNTSRGSSRA